MKWQSCVVDYCKNVDWETVDGYVDQLKTLYERFAQVNDSEKGETNWLYSR